MMKTRFSIDFCKAKSVKTGYWVYGYYVEHVYDDTTTKPPKKGYLCYITDRGAEYTEIDITTKLKSTGVLDVNGDNIWEGDVIKVYRLVQGREETVECNRVHWDYARGGFMPLIRWGIGFGKEYQAEILPNN